MLEKCQNYSSHFLDELTIFGANRSAVERTEAQTALQSPDDSDATPMLNQYLKADFFLTALKKSAQTWLDTWHLC